MNLKGLLLIVAAYCFGIITMGTFTIFTKNREKSPVMSAKQAKKDAMTTADIPFTPRDGFQNTNRMRCNCSVEGDKILKVMETEEPKETEGRRKVELRKFKRRTKSSKETLMIVDGSVPLSYPVQGVVVAPEEWEDIPGLKVVDNTIRNEYQVKLSSSELGVLTIRATVPKVKVNGLSTATLTIISRSLAHLNRQLEFVVYVNTVFDIDARDFVRFVYLHHEAIFPINIRVRRSPILYDPRPGDINDKVTILTKTFLRYPSVRFLIQSIQTYYPKMRIIVADDNRPFEDLQSEHVDHYIMPHKSGWFGGRNLGVSQVTTPYLLWLDDDYVFHEETKLEVMVDILDNSNLDVVSGIRGKVPLYFTKMAMIPGEDDDDGVCILHETHKNYGQVPGFPDCFFATRVMNFFMGRTDGIRSVGFYPAYSRKADEEFYLDALGKLRMAACKGVHVHHNRTWSNEYNKHRWGQDIKNYHKMQDRIIYFRSNANCWHYV
ncbi:PREDICTED: beta-1,4 N-acetylgalactosaminyltransferase 1-like isoform X1 [Branchiostoma belcheri]|uniref:Beta-1,4 N-acetylgalactosaminyltransferase 1-like isoform X1 n=1 Tax=Branchiostoma belcheri TaxID=7741 RepID=A0A6P4YD88_BRABE|nr:PREDICTED: beta-1,4 N-acetylgalactosaminyltransferase 1-like isoform X1 [Branchiostoma belcheri]